MYLLTVKSHFERSKNASFILKDQNMFDSMSEEPEVRKKRSSMKMNDEYLVCLTIISLLLYHSAKL